MDSCPTQAIIAPGIIDARKCISFHTIENKDEIPQNIKIKCGNNLFGCDICQEVCPHNIRAQESSISEKYFSSLYLDVDEIINLNKDEFYEKYAGSSLIRAKINGLKRNALIVKENSC